MEGFAPTLLMHLAPAISSVELDSSKTNLKAGLFDYSSTLLFDAKDRIRTGGAVKSARKVSNPVHSTTLPPQHNDVTRIRTGKSSTENRVQACRATKPLTHAKNRGDGICTHVSPTTTGSKPALFDYSSTPLYTATVRLELTLFGLTDRRLTFWPRSLSEHRVVVKNNA